MIGSYTVNLLDAECVPCPAGTFSGTSGATGSCAPCPQGESNHMTIEVFTMPCIGSFSASGASLCSLCQSIVPGVSATTLIPYYYWTSPLGAIQQECTCAIGYTGTNCEFSMCSAYLPGASLGSLLFQADTKLRQFSANASAYSMLDVSMYLYNLLQVGVDTNGDGNITRVEMMVALGNRLIYSPGMPALNLWCQTATFGSNCYNQLGDVVPVQTIFSDALMNFNLSNSFDGSGMLYKRYSIIIHRRFRHSYLDFIQRHLPETIMVNCHVRGV